MTDKARQIVEMALELDFRERNEVISQLLASIDEAVDDDADEAWDAEIARRVEALESGTARTMPVSEALSKLEAANKRA